MRTVLVDMDGVLADWGAEYDRHLERYGNAAARIRRHQQQTSFDLFEGCGENEAAIIHSIMEAPGYYAGLDPIPGAIDALHEMADSGHDVRIVTTPWIANPTCASDKLAWVARHLGRDFALRTVITSDKTIVHGDYLIDDKPLITGCQAPAWEHVLFDQPYNQEATQRRLTDWAQWKEVIA